jgi:hypothetical protein
MNRSLRKAVLQVQRLFNDFDSLVKSPSSPSISAHEAPIFLISAPRAGSTLIYQTMLGHIRLAYISNIMALAPSHMIKLCKLSKRVAYGYDGKIRESEYGHVPGFLSPNEAWKITQKWFRESTNDREREYVRRTFHMISSITGCPMLLKNPMNTFSIQEIRSILPNSRFIFLHRDPMKTAQSIILARRKASGGDDRWFSVQPPGYESVMNKPPFYQVVWQVLSIEKFVTSLLSNDPKRFLTVKYESFCKKPYQVLQEIRNAFELEWRDDSLPLEQSIPASDEIRLTANEWQELENIYHELKSADSEVT